MTTTGDAHAAAWQSSRARMVAHAYRMLGSWQAAEDVAQEAWLRLTAPERAAYVLRTGFAYSFKEISEVIDHTDAHCRQLFRRASLRPATRASTPTPARTANFSTRWSPGREPTFQQRCRHSLAFALHRHTAVTMSHGWVAPSPEAVRRHHDDGSAIRPL